MFQLERNGFSVPGDVSLIGYDDSFYTGDIGLTTIRQDPVEMARVAARMTLDLIDEKPIEQPYIVFPAQLKVRSSTSRVKVGSHNKAHHGKSVRQPHNNALIAHCGKWRKNRQSMDTQCVIERVRPHTFCGGRFCARLSNTKRRPGEGNGRAPRIVTYRLWDSMRLSAKPRIRKPNRPRRRS